MLNSEFMRQRARDLSDRLAAQTNDDRERIRNAYNLLLSRAPTADEEQIGLSYLESAPTKSTEDPIQKAPTPWEQYAQVLLSCNEFLFLR
jgi:hypothetical protein